MIRMSDGGTSPGMYRSPARLYVNKDKSRLVPEDSPEAAFVLCGENGEIPLEVAARYGLYPESAPDPADAPAPADEPDPEDSPSPGPVTPSDDEAESKAEQPKADKAVKPAENKGR